MDQGFDFEDGLFGGFMSEFWPVPGRQCKDGASRSSFILPGRSYITPAKARRHAADTLRDWDVQSECAERVLLIVSELVTNSIQHSHSPYIVLSFEICAGSVLIFVSTQGSTLGMPIGPRSHEVMDLSGRGLFLVDIMAARWGTERVKDKGITVWAAVGLGEGVSVDGEGART
ncbi:ATP-binding protein [Streptomyces goshikiensis]|uniref:ATP-binding protein n=1 Tax=Streptomyces goshikiensis TaxID=1942 RepID=UPI00369CC990